MGLKYSDAPLVSALTGSEVWGVAQAGSSRRLPLDLSSNWGKRVTITNSSYTISDQGISVLEVNIGASIITLPDLALWSGRTIIVRKISDTVGTITIQRSGSDVIGNNSATSVLIGAQGDQITLFAGSNEWNIVSWINITDDESRMMTRFVVPARIVSRSNNPEYEWEELDAPADEKFYRMIMSNGDWFLQSRSDDKQTNTNIVSIGRNANTITSFSIFSDVAVTGSFSKGSGSFKINHPLKPDTHHLVHSFIEGPNADLVYSGMVKLNKGRAVVNIDKEARMDDGTLIKLCHNFRWMSSNESGFTAVKCNLKGNKLTIQSETSCMDMVYWQVIGERKDKHMLEADWTDNDGRVIVQPVKKVK